MSRIIAACFVALTVAIVSRYGPRLVSDFAQQTYQAAPKAVKRVERLNQAGFSGVVQRPARRH